MSKKQYSVDDLVRMLQTPGTFDRCVKLLTRGNSHFREHPASAEDSAQEAMVRAWAKRHTYKGKSAPLTFVLSFAKHTGSEAIRSDTRELQVDPMDVRPVEPTATAFDSQARRYRMSIDMYGGNPEELYMRAERLANVLRDIQKTEAGAVLMSLRGDDLTDIATAVGKTEVAARQQRKREVGRLL